jgi:hypothetical protein
MALECAFPNSGDIDLSSRQIDRCPANLPDSPDPLKTLPCQIRPA